MKITREFHKKLLTELQHRRKVQRQKIKEDVMYAAEQGDFYRENFPFQHATEKLVENEKRIKEIEEVLKEHKIVKSNNEIIDIGSEVVLKDELGKSKRIKIVDDIEVDPRLGKISLKSPLGKALLGKKVGGSINIEINSTSKIYKILKPNP